MRFEEISRRGKFLVFRLGAGRRTGYMLAHLRMSGSFRLLPAGRKPPPHARLMIELERGLRLYFNDPRKFGRFWMVDDPDQVLGDLGPEPLEPGFSPAVFRGIFQVRRGRIKTLLLNQRLLAGIGNIYADESLWRARIHPLRRACGLKDGEWRALHGAIRATLRRAIASRGTDAGDGVVEGDFRPAVYQRAGKPCRRCGARILRITIGQRGTHFCPACQKSGR